MIVIVVIMSSSSSIVTLGWSSSFLVFEQTLDPVQLLLERHPDGVPDAARTLGDFLALFVLDVDTLSPEKSSNSVWDFYIINIISTYRGTHWHCTVCITSHLRPVVFFRFSSILQATLGTVLLSDWLQDTWVVSKGTSTSTKVQFCQMTGWQSSFPVQTCS